MWTSTLPKINHRALWEEREVSQETSERRRIKSCKNCPETERAPATVRRRKKKKQKQNKTRQQWQLSPASSVRIIRHASDGWSTVQENPAQVDSSTVQGRRSGALMP